MRRSGSQAEPRSRNTNKFGYGGGCRCRAGNGSGRTLATAVVVLASCANVAWGASGDSAFQWKFDGMFSTTLNQCQSYRIIAQPPPSNQSLMGTPPFYMIARKPQGVTTRSFIGTDPNNLEWTVDQPEGSQLLLTVADSLLLSGGQPPSLYVVAAGTTASCLPPAPTTNITIVTNVTRAETCQPVGFRVFGGQMPYNLSISAVNSPVVTNVTMGPTDDVFTFINRADPNGQFLAAISDATGTWGTSTPLISTFGSTDYECVGLISTSGNSSSVDQHPAPPSKSNTATIVLAVVIPLLFVLAALAGGWWWWRKKREERMREPEPAFLPEAWSAPVTASSMGASEAGGGTSLMGQPMGAGGNSEKARYFAVPQIHFTGSGSGSGSGSRGVGDDMQTQFGVGVGGRSGSSSNADASSTTSYPYPSGSGSGSGSGTGAAVGAAAGRSNSTAKGRRMYGSTANANNAQQLGPNGLPLGWQVEPQILIQHRDGGAVPAENAPNVQEIPPPYMFDTVEEGDEGGAGAGAGAGARPSTSGSGSGPSMRQLPPLPQSPQTPHPSSRPGSSGSGLQTPVMTPTTVRSPPPPISPPPPPGIPQPQPYSHPHSQSHSHSHSQTSLPSSSSPTLDASRYSAPLPNLPGPLPPPPAPTGLPANPAAPLRLRQNTAGQTQMQSHSPQPSIQSQNNGVGQS